MIKFESESHFEQFIESEFNKTGVCIVDDCHYDKLIRQFDTKGYGIPDMVFFSDDLEVIDENEEYRHMSVHVVELKNEKIKVKDVTQILRYKTYFDRAFKGLDVSVSYSLVVKPGIVDNDDACWLINNINEVDFCEFTLNPSSGIEFKSKSGWYKTSEDLKPALNMFGMDESIERNEDLF